MALAYLFSHLIGMQYTQRLCQLEFDDILDNISTKSKFIKPF